MAHKKLKGLLTPTILILVISNTIPLAGAILVGWSASEILLMYWAESGVIGIFNLLKMLRSGFSLDPDKPAITQWIATIFFSVFFLIHYGGFMLGHLLFLSSMINVNFTGIRIMLDTSDYIRLLTETAIGALLALTISHGISFKKHFLEAKLYIDKSSENFMVAPYARILIMHITILGGGFFILQQENGDENIGLIAILVSLKTIVDGFAHYREHRKK